MSDNGFERSGFERSGAGYGGSTTGATWRSGSAPQPPAFDPWAQPELFRGVLTRRVFACIIDVIVLSIPIVLAVIFIGIFGLITLSLGWWLYGLVYPASIVWALVYYGASLSGPHSATIGMRMMGLQLRTSSGAPAHFVVGAVHAVLFWISISVLTPFVLLVGLFNGRRRLLHDIVLGTVMINGAVPAPTIQPAGRW
jgi:uncharacterized RDD family membrane protein YckC